MELGFALFADLKGHALTYEVFPSASYTLFASDRSLKVELFVSDLADGPKDMLDAYVAALTVREFVQGRGQAVGGGDGKGQIVLPRPIPNEVPNVGTWPSNTAMHPTAAEDEGGGRW